MMLDLTKRLPVEASYRRTYRVLRLALYVLLVAVAIAVAIRFVFPDRDRYFDFRIYFGPKNTIAEPRFTTGKPVEKGVVPNGQPMLFNASVLGSFSAIRVRMTVSDTDTPDENGTLSVVRAYRAFLYPEGEPVTHRDDTLLFRIQGNYYQVRDGRTIPFVSERAYLSHFRSEDALETDETALDRFPRSEDMIGFIDGTLLSYGESVYAVEGPTLRPIDSVDTFLIKGYQWPSVIAATGEEFGMYTRGKLYTIQQPHPNGTIFHLKDGNRYFLVEDGRKREILDRTVLSEYAAVIPVEIGYLPEPETCTPLLHRFLFTRTYECEIPLDRFSDTTINEYQFALTPKKPMALTELETDFLSYVNRENWLYFTNELKTKLLTRYGSTGE